MGSYAASGDVDLTLNFAPEPGTNLTVVKNTGLPFIDGTFSNLPNGTTARYVIIKNTAERIDGQWAISELFVD